MAYTEVLLSDLLKERKKNIYCFGAGRMFDDFVREFSNYHLKEIIKVVVDNHPERVGYSSKIMQGAHIPIISFEEMVKNIKDGEKILITAGAYEEIIKQFEKTKELENICYYSYPVLRTEQYDFDRLKVRLPLRLSSFEKVRIPKKIHYCWFGRKEIPVQYRKWMESWKKYCPDYEVIEWNELNYDVHKNKYVSQAYEAGKWAFVSDFARIDIVNKYGGVYLDADVELTKNLDELLMNNGFCGFETSEYVNYGLGFGSEKGHPILCEIKEYYENKDFVRSDGTFDQTTCPFIQTEIMKRHGLVCNGEFQTVEGLTVYPSRVLCGMSPHSFRIGRDLSCTYAIHHFSGSWIEDKKEKNTFISAMKKWSNNDNYIYPDI